MKLCPKCGKEYQDDNTLCPLDGMVLQKTGNDLIGQTLASKYRIEELISEGGMGTVYRATHILMDKTVALKVLHPALAADDKIVARFTREAKAASRISHPHALVVTDFGESENGVVFLVMEYLRGRTLKEVIRSEAPLSLSRVAEITRQVCGALDAAHAEGIVHRDLKSDNIMLEGVGPAQDWAKVLDFGIAKIQEPLGGPVADLTAPNLIIGTPQYMSPEQCAQSSEIDARSDIYSLGIILFEMLTGHVPFVGDSATAIMLRHLQEPPPSVLSERSDLPPEVDAVVARALAKRPSERFQSAGELAEALARSAETEAAVVAPVLPIPEATTTIADTPDLNTNRIIVPTAQNRHEATTVGEEHDEATIVRPGTTRRMEPVVEREAQAEEVFAPLPPPATSFSPWRIAIPAALALVVVFAVVYALQSRSGSDTAEQPPLTSDPNSMPVQPAAPPSGQGESGILPASVATPGVPATSGDGTLGGVSPVPVTTGQGGGNVSTGGSANVVSTPNENGGNANRNNQQNNNGNNEEEEEPQPEPPPAQRATPRPTPPIVNATPSINVETPREKPSPVRQPPEAETRPPQPSGGSPDPPTPEG